MTKREYKLVKLIKNSVQCPQKTREEFLIWISFYDLKEFVELVGGNYFDEGGIEVTLLDGYIAFDAKDLLEYFDIDLDVFDDED